MNNSINFKKQRELGSILTDIFKFIRLNWKLLFELILKIAGPALLILLIGFIFYLQSFVGGFGIIETVDAIDNFSTNVILSLLVVIVAGLVYYALLNGVVLHFIKSYIKNGGIVNKAEVIQGVKDDFWSLIGTSFLVAIIIFVGAMFCVIPGIYLGIVLSIAYAVVVFENRSVIDTISYCFDLVKGEWWATFATLFVTGLLYYFINIIFQVPQYIYFFIKAFTGSQEISADPSVMFDWVYLSLSTVGMVFQYLLYTIIVICSAFIYFNLNEKKNFTGTIEAIDSLGANNQ
ncbi:MULTISPECIES: hypothetical protein [Aequorivita]|uniref:Glycerophosphoryl diester phosphodiesterase membrane domain-containing protein n=2 Tax=Aequorivita TaxID=153265 RepID=A0AB35YQT3_9FLAO|nr:hypothetical protein [Aequorivita sp. Ant34-E75]WGF91767.1 hypothetical protein QCQ61_11165 [Aequorivita sp. Ant34-E75]